MDSTVLFEKIMSLFLMMAIVVLIGLGTFYFKRRVSYLEAAVKDQAQITQNILGMLNTMIKPDERERNAPPPLRKRDHPINQRAYASSASNAMTMDVGQLGMGIDVAVIDLGAMLSPEAASSHPLSHHLSFPERASASVTESTLVEIEPMDNLPQAEHAQHVPTVRENGIDVFGRIVVSDTEHEDTLAKDVDSSHESDIDSHEEAEAEAEAWTATGKDAEVGMEAEKKTEKGTETGAGTEMVSAAPNDVSFGSRDEHAYDKLKVGELRELLEKRGYAEHAGHKYKQMKKTDLIATLNTLDSLDSLESVGETIAEKKDGSRMEITKSKVENVVHLEVD